MRGGKKKRRKKKREARRRGAARRSTINIAVCGAVVRCSFRAYSGQDRYNYSALSAEAHYDYRALSAATPYNYRACSTGSPAVQGGMRSLLGTLAGCQTTRAPWRERLVAVSRFLKLTVQNNFAENKNMRRSPRHRLGL